MGLAVTGGDGGGDSNSGRTLCDDRSGDLPDSHESSFCFPGSRDSFFFSHFLYPENKSWKQNAVKRGYIPFIPRVAA